MLTVTFFFFFFYASHLSQAVKYRHKSGHLLLSNERANERKVLNSYRGKRMKEEKFRASFLIQIFVTGREEIKMCLHRNLYDQNSGA